MPSNPFVWPALLLSCSVFAALPSPQDLRVDAVNTQYLLRWDWNYTLANYNMVTFTAESTFSHRQREERFYTSRCTSVAQRWCDFSSDLQSYSGSYILRVRAEERDERSNWAWLKFCPDEDATLGAPSHLRVDSGDAMITVSFKEPMAGDGVPMSSILNPMAFRLRYWQAETPNQKQEKDFKATQYTMALKAQTEYCLQVSAFSEGYGKTSNYTQPQCVTTLRHLRVWQVLLYVMGPVVLIIGLIYMCHREMRLFPPHTTPSCILEPPKYHLPLLQPQEMSYVVTAVVAMPTTQQVPRGRMEVMVMEASGGQYSNSSQDSGFSSGEESGGSSSDQNIPMKGKGFHSTGLMTAPMDPQLQQCLVAVV